METICVNTSHSYKVLLGENLLNRLPELINDVSQGRKVGIVTDSVVDKLYANKINHLLTEGGYSVSKYILPNGEGSKNLTVLSDILEFFASRHFNRKDILMSIGGGVVGDITGLAAALYMRGIPFIQVPTTLLSMVDASVGGKTAVDLNAGKNLVGAFWQPCLVIADIQILRWLPKTIFAEGMAEVIKSDLIKNIGISNIIRQGSVNDNLAHIVASCIEMKRDIVQQDEYETLGLRKVLNMGHTVAHSIEKLSDYSVSHGLSVATGLVWEAAIACHIGICTQSLVDEIRNSVKVYNLYIKVPFNTVDLVNAMRNDKKNDDSNIDFVFPATYGKWEERKIPQQELISIINSTREQL